MQPIHSAAELYAHAIAIEREAAERYSEFAERMADLGNDALAELFDRLAGFEAEHLETLLRRTDGVELPAPVAGAYKWLDAGAPETAARELIFRLMTPRHALDRTPLLDLFGRMNAKDALTTAKPRMEARLVREQVGGE